VGGGSLGARHDHGFGHRHLADGRHDGLRALFMHRQRRREHAGVRVGQLQTFEDALYAPVFAELAVQGVEANVGLEGRQAGGNVAIDVEAGHAIAFTLQRFGHGVAGTQADLALRRPPSHEHGYMVIRSRRCLDHATRHMLGLRCAGRHGADFARGTKAQARSLVNVCSVKQCFAGKRLFRKK
jgi:hypothetical protein